MKCQYCSSDPCICIQCADARNNGRHDGRMASLKSNPYPTNSLLYQYWVLGFNEGKEDKKKIFNDWKNRVVMAVTVNHVFVGSIPGRGAT